MVKMSVFAATQMGNKYAHTKDSGHKESWEEIAFRQGHFVMKPYLPRLQSPVTQDISDRKFIPGGRYLYAVGRRYAQVNNCFLFSAEDSREGWGIVMHDTTNALMTGGGVGVVYSGLRPEDSLIRGLGGKSTGPLALMKMVNEAGRYIVQGGSRRSAIWAGLHWNHPDVFKFIAMKDWSESIRRCKSEDFNFPAPMDGTNISVILDDAFFAAYENPNDTHHTLAREVYWAAVNSMLRNGEPGFSVDIGEHAGEHLRNACTEVTSADNGDMCNLGSINLARIDTLDEFVGVVERATAFLMCGTLYSQLPLPYMYDIRKKNRRIGLGLMGVHEWLMKRGYAYGPNEELGEWLEHYKLSTGFANRYADELHCSRPIATRSIAPTGTISIVAETTSGMEPVFAKAYKRRYLDGKTWKFQYVVDATALRLVQEHGVDPEQIEDAYDLANDVPRRMDMQTFLQRYVDHGISSTINLPAWGTYVNDEKTVDSIGETIYQRLPLVRGMTVYPDGSRGGQPLVPWSFKEALANVGKEFLEAQETGDLSCEGGVCGS